MRNPSKPPHERQHKRPVNKEEVKYWVPSQQAWLSLDEMAYLAMRRAVRSQELLSQGPTRVPLSPLNAELSYEL
jgi:hypothetical protein